MTADGVLTVGALRAALAGVDDGMEVLVHTPDDLDPGDLTVIESAAPDGTCEGPDVFRLTLADPELRDALAAASRSPEGGTTMPEDRLPGLPGLRPRARGRGRWRSGSPAGRIAHQRRRAVDPEPAPFSRGRGDRCLRRTRPP